MTGSPDRDQAGCGGDVAAYALGALDAGEVSAFERHLGSCAVCADELRGFRLLVDGIAASAPPHRAPAAVRRRVMRTVREDARRAAPRRARPRLPRPSFALPLAATGLAALAAVIVVLLVPGGHAGSGRRVSAQVSGIAGQVSLELSHGRAELDLQHVTAPPRGKIYEVWLKRSGASPQPTTALFGVDHAGDASVEVPGSLHGVTEVLVTPEPTGGSRTPTHAPVIVARI